MTSLQEYWVAISCSVCCALSCSDDHVEQSVGSAKSTDVEPDGNTMDEATSGTNTGGGGDVGGKSAVADGSGGSDAVASGSADAGLVFTEPEDPMATFENVGLLDSDGGTCGGICSRDLRSILDCDGVTIQTCQTGFACLGANCVEDACLAAQESQSSLGCDYWAVKTDSTDPGVRTACFAAYVSNTWSVPVTIEVSRQGHVFESSDFVRIPRGQGADMVYEAYDPGVGVPVDDVAIVFLAHEGQAQAPCPATPAVDGQVGVFYSGRGEAFHIRTSGPVSAHTVMPYGGGTARATSATLLLPTNSWGQEYIAVNAYRKSYQGGDHGQPSLNILAIQDDTEVTLLPTVEVLAGEGVDGGPAATPLSYSLDAGEYLQLSQDEELTGTPIAATKPIGVWGASSCLNVPFDVGKCDSAHQQLPPLQTMGNEYVAVRHENRNAAEALGLDEAPPWRLVGAVDGTQLTWAPQAPVGAPVELNVGEVFEFEHTGPLLVRSQDAEFPFYAGQYMTGGESIDEMSEEGDPEWVNITPSAQFLNRYVFFADPTYAETSLVVVRTVNAGAVAEVTLDCAGALDGWQAVGDYQYTRVQLVTGDFENVGDCTNGRHEIVSEAPFGVTVWGWGTAGTTPSTGYVSYAYPAGAGLRTINDVTVPVVIR